jgi:hypothetical protein
MCNFAAFFTSHSTLVISTKPSFIKQWNKEKRRFEMSIRAARSEDNFPVIVLTGQCFPDLKQEVYSSQGRTLIRAERYNTHNSSAIPHFAGGFEVAPNENCFAAAVQCWSL